MVHKEVLINVENDFDIFGEVKGNEESGKVIIFSHGFNVRRENKKIFTDISNVLAKEYLCVLFDYSNVLQDGKSMEVLPYDKNAKRLSHAIDWVRTTYSPKEYVLVAHSAGCFIASLAKEEVFTKSIFISVPPEGSSYETLVQSLQQRDGCEVNVDGLTKLKKSDGSARYLFKPFWDYFKQMPPEIDMYEEYAKLSEIYFIRAMDEDIIKWGDYSRIKKCPNSHYIELPGDHNFSGKSRVGLLQKIIEIL